MTPVTAPLSTPTETAPAAHAGALVPAQPVTMVVVEATTVAENGLISPNTQTPSPVTPESSDSRWPNLRSDKPNPGSDDWRALQGRAFSLRLRGPHGQIGA